MILALLGIFWLTITGANYPSEMLSKFLFWIEDQLVVLFQWLHVPEVLTGLLLSGVYRVLAWVVSVFWAVQYVLQHRPDFLYGSWQTLS